MITLDSIVCELIGKSGRSIPHYYLDYMRQAKPALRELRFDILKAVNTKIITLNENGNGKLPCDYHDFLRVGVPIGQYVRPMLQYNKISSLPNYNSAGKEIPYGTAEVDSNYPMAYISPVVKGIGWAILDEGRWYGYGMGRETDTYTIIKERGIIQVDEHVKEKKIYLEYITDGSEIVPSTQVDPYAQGVIEQYIIWQTKRFNRNSGAFEVREEERLFEKMLLDLSIRLSPITIEDVKRIYRRAFRGSMKH